MVIISEEVLDRIWKHTRDPLEVLGLLCLLKKESWLNGRTELEMAAEKALTLFGWGHKTFFKYLDQLVDSDLAIRRPGGDLIICSENQQPKKEKEEKKEKAQKKEKEEKEKEILRSIPTNFENLARDFLLSQSRNLPGLISRIGPNQIKMGAKVLYELTTLDGYPISRIEKALRWVNQDPFWSHQILSLSGLRKRSRNNGQTRFVNILVSMDGPRNRWSSGKGLLDSAVPSIAIDSRSEPILSRLKQTFKTITGMEPAGTRIRSVEQAAAGWTDYFDRLPESVRKVYLTRMELVSRFCSHLENRYRKWTEFPVTCFLLDSEAGRTFLSKEQVGCGLDFRTGEPV